MWIYIKEIPHMHRKDLKQSDKFVTTQDHFLFFVTVHVATVSLENKNIDL